MSITALAFTCHIFTCTPIIPPRRVPCDLRVIDGVTAVFDGEKHTLKQFMWGPERGYEARTQRGWFTMFTRGRKPYLWLLTEYTSKDDYIKFQCGGVR